MTYYITIRENKTGNVVTIPSEHDDDGNAVHMWIDGNYSCDCNRRLFYDRELNRESGSDKCGNTEFSVRIDDESRELLYSELEETN